MKGKYTAIALAGAIALSSAPLGQNEAYAGVGDGKIRHVLLISIDGMHALDYINCANGVSGVNSGAAYCTTLAGLGKNGIGYVNTSTAKPSDSFPGLMALVSGGSPRTVGAYYDVAYDRTLAPPVTTTWNGLAGGSCPNTTGQVGYTTEYEEGIDKSIAVLNGGAPAGEDGGIDSIDPNRLERDPNNDCKPVYPWDFVRTNTIYGVIHKHGGYTAWSDKHPAYSSVAGQGGPGTLDDYYSPEINSPVVGLPGVTTALGDDCTNVRDASQTGAWTDSFENIQCYDQLKVNAILHEIDGLSHDGKTETRVPTIFGMNFQAVSVGQKLIENAATAQQATGGYIDGAGTPTPLLLNEIEFVDAAIGQMVSELNKQGLTQSTLVIVTAKHGQSPIDKLRVTRIKSNSPAHLIASLLPDSESPNTSGGIGPTEDDVSLLWLADPGTLSGAVTTLENNLDNAGIGEIFYGPGLQAYFNAPGLPPNGDPRTPDIVITPNIGVIYTGSNAKQMEHGGFARDDTNVMMLLSNPRFSPILVTAPVETAQVAPTILDVLGIDPNELQAVQTEHTQVLPGLQFPSH